MGSLETYARIWGRSVALAERRSQQAFFACDMMRLLSDAELNRIAPSVHFFIYPPMSLLDFSEFILNIATTLSTVAAISLLKKPFSPFSVVL